MGTQEVVAVVWSDERTGLEVLERAECLRLLGAGETGRIGVLEGGHPLILPVNYGIDGDDVVLRSNEGSKVDAARGGPACFEIDGTDPDRRAGWSVVVRGRLEVVTALDSVLRDRIGALADPWIGERSHLLRLRSTAITGRRLRPAGEHR